MQNEEKYFHGIQICFDVNTLRASRVSAEPLVPCAVVPYGFSICQSFHMTTSIHGLFWLAKTEIGIIPVDASNGESVAN
jgi:hypothetical protein